MTSSVQYCCGVYIPTAMLLGFILGLQSQGIVWICIAPSMHGLESGIVWIWLHVKPSRRYTGKVLVEHIHACLPTKQDFAPANMPPGTRDMLPLLKYLPTIIKYTLMLPALMIGVKWPYSQEARTIAMLHIISEIRIQTSVIRMS